MKFPTFHGKSFKIPWFQSPIGLLMIAPVFFWPIAFFQSNPCGLKTASFTEKHPPSVTTFFGSSLGKDEHRVFSQKKTMEIGKP